MAHELVSRDRLDAGRDYLNALSELGFEPEGAMWSVRTNDPSTLELSLFSSLVDRVGPQAVYDALFNAFDKALTPRNFEPWEVSVYSPGMQFYECFTGRGRPPGAPLRGVFKMGAEVQLLDKDNRVIGAFRDDTDRESYWDWIYIYPEGKKQGAVPQLKAWHRFEERIAKAA